MSIDLTGELVRLRRPEPDDVDDILAMRADPDHLRTGTLSLPLAPGPAWVEGPWMERSQRPDDPGLNGFVVTARDDGRFLGTCGYSVDSPVHRVAVLGIGLRTDEQGKGYGTDAVAVLTRFAFEQHGVAVVRLTARAENAGGIRAYEKAGFVTVGRLREEVWRDGAWHDAVEMAVVRPDLGAGRAHG